MIEYTELSLAWLIGLMLGGLCLLFFGGDGLCRGASALALRLKVNPVTIGLTVVAVTTSMPELMTSLYAASSGNSGLAVGNIVGSNLANIGLILGLAALICPVHIHVRLIKKEVPLLIAVTVLFTLLSLQGTIEQWGGIFMLVGFAVYIIFVLKQAEREDIITEESLAVDVEHSRTSLKSALFFIVGGGVLLHIGAEFLVHSSREIALKMGLSDALIGLTIVAIGTSLPELAASMVAAFRKQSDLCAGNLIGSNLFNILLIGGGITAIYPIEVNSRLLWVDYPAMFLLTGVVWWFFWSGRVITRNRGLLLLLLYIVIMSISCTSQLGLLFPSL